MNTAPIVTERTYNAPASKVWEAITDKNKMKQWYFELAEFKPVVGFEFCFYGENEGRSFKHLCRITEVVTGKKLAYTWKYEGYPGASLVTFELFDEGDETRLRLTHACLDTFPDTATNDFARSNFEAGWNYILGTSLQGFLEKE